ncbi:MAG: cell division protein FtsQ/DivIB [Candidatus Geothermincolia bacterium]
MHMPELRRFARVGAWVILIVVVVAGGLAVSLALFTGTCSIKNVNITGSKYLPADYLKQLSGIADYRNLVTLPVGKLARNLESNAWVRKASVQRHLLHTVNIKIDERKPVAVLDYSGAEFLVAEDGLVIAKISAEQFPELPRVHGGAAAPPTIGALVPDRKVMECIHVIGKMSPAMQAVLALGNPFDGRGQVFISRMGFNIVYGHDSDSKKKNEVLEAIVTDVKNNKRRIAYVDLRVPDSPVIKPL